MNTSLSFRHPVFKNQQNSKQGSSCSEAKKRGEVWVRASNPVPPCYFLSLLLSCCSLLLSLTFNEWIHRTGFVNMHLVYLSCVMHYKISLISLILLISLISLIWFFVLHSFRFAVIAHLLEAGFAYRISRWELSSLTQK